MKISLNGSKKPAAAPGAAPAAASTPARGSASRSASPAPKVQGSETYGRSCAPPPPGSSYWEFLHWASEGGMPLPDDTDLAITLWAGAPAASEEADTAPGMR